VRLAVLDARAPFEPQPADPLAERLCRALREHGHAAELVHIPFSESPPERVVDQLLAIRLLHLENVDRAIALGFPAHHIEHHDKVVWLVRLFGERSACARGAVERHVREAVRAADRAHLPQATRIHAGSARARARLREDTGLGADVLLPPLRHPGVYRCDAYGDHLLALGPIAWDTRQSVALAALALTPSRVRLVIAGPPASAGDVAALRALAHELGVERRVELLAQPIDDATRVGLLAGARAVLCLPRPQDCYVEPVLEAFASHKAVVVFADPGRPVELVRDGVDGRIAGSVAGLAGAIDDLGVDAAMAEDYGRAGFRHLQDAGASWEAVVGELVR
jgi:glycosyltransferase involved in cell wall biosynthesis